MILSKKQMSEEDIKLQYITPAVTAKWDIRKVTMETQITDGKINLKGNFVFREKPKRADYLLYLNANNPIAVIEAKDNSDRNRYIESAKLHGKRFTRNYITFDEVMRGGKLLFRMSDTPNLSRGTADGDRPYSFSREK